MKTFKQYFYEQNYSGVRYDDGDFVEDEEDEQLPPKKKKSKKLKDEQSKFNEPHERKDILAML